MSPESGLDPNNVTRGHSSRRARASRVAAKRAKPPAQPVVVYKADPLAWAYAVKVARDPRRLAVQPDGSVIIYNKAVR